MGTLNAIYVRAADAQTVAALIAEQPTAYTEPGTDFFAIDRSIDDFRCPERQLAEISARLDTDVIWLSFQSVVDAFQFYHWRAGHHLRSLIYGSFEQERTWERVEGTSEIWERQALFEASRLEIGLKYARDAAEERELQRIYRDLELTAGSTEPSINARESARKVAECYRLPGWFLEEGSGDD